MKLISLAAFISIIPDYSGAQSFDQRLHEWACDNQLVENFLIDQSAIRDEAFIAPDLKNSGLVFRFPTNEIGKWVLVKIGEDETELISISQQKIEIATIDQECAWRTEIHTGLMNTGPTDFTDTDLAALLSRNERGIIYLWSPHMQLSLDGVRELNNLSEEFAVPLLVLLDPNADIGFAASAARRAEIGKTPLRRVNSLELYFRNFTIHAPTLITYANGEITGPAAPGYRSPEHYRMMITKWLNTADQE